jgi:2,3-bisphosphoglycerate-independent phosphoglycerate mutase
VLLVIRDGWGSNPHSDQDAFNAVRQARTACDDRLRARYPVTLVKTSGEDVGLPDGIMGNSEVGHENIGAGRIVEQELLRLNRLFSDGLVASNAAWRGAVDRVKTRGSRLHLMGILSDAGVHGMLEHLYGFLERARIDGVPPDRVFIHAFMDGRDTPPMSGLGYVRAVEARCRELGVGRIATVCGRFWAMDRDNRWDRVAKAYVMLTGRRSDAESASGSTAGTASGTAAGPTAGTTAGSAAGAVATASAPSAEAAVQAYYDHPLTPTQQGDEFIAPTWITDAAGEPLATIGDGDAVVFYNYRGDRPRELTKAFVLDGFKDFDRGPKLDLFYATMTAYEAGLPVHVILDKPPKLKHILGEVVSAAGLAQFRCAETEKNPHVTFFFNNYRGESFPGETRAGPASPKVATYDLQPEMSAAEVTRLAREAILSGKYALIVVNYANPDMVGHTGSLPAAIKAVEVTDAGVGELLDALAQVGGRAVIGADHGNCEQMWDPVNRAPHTSHTLNRVEYFVVGEDFAAGRTRLREGGRLADIAPTVLDLMGLPKPAEMTGRSLLEV